MIEMNRNVLSASCLGLSLLVSSGVCWGAQTCVPQNGSTSDASPTEISPGRCYVFSDLSPIHVVVRSDTKGPFVVMVSGCGGGGGGGGGGGAVGSGGGGGGGSNYFKEPLKLIGGKKFTLQIGLGGIGGTILPGPGNGPSISFKSGLPGKKTTIVSATGELLLGFEGGYGGEAGRPNVWNPANGLGKAAGGKGLGSGGGGGLGGRTTEAKHASETTAGANGTKSTSQFAVEGGKGGNYVATTTGGYHISGGGGGGGGFGPIGIDSGKGGDGAVPSKSAANNDSGTPSTNGGRCAGGGGGAGWDGDQKLGAGGNGGNGALILDLR